MTIVTAEQRISELEAALAHARAELEAARAEAPLLRTLMRDISERKAIEAKLRDTQEWLHLAQTAGDVAAYSFDFQTDRLSWSPSAYALYGIPQDSEPSLDLWLSCIHPEDRASVQAVAAAALERGEDVDQQFRAVHRDGSIRWIHDRARIKLDAHGRLERLAGLNIDVTDLREREIALQRSQSRFKALAEAVMAVTWSCDSDGALSPDNAEWGAYTGQSPKEYSRYGWLDALHPDDRQVTADIWRQAVNTRTPYECEYRLRRADGTYRITLVRGAPVVGADGAVVEWVGVNFDVTEQRQFDFDLKDREERLRAALAGAGAGTFRWDIVANTLDWDVELDRLFGLPPGQTARSLEEFVARVHPDDRAEVVERCRRCAEAGDDFEMTFRVVWPDGSLHWLYDRGRTHFGPDGRPLYMTGACTDMTERVVALRRLEDSEARLRMAQEAGGIGSFIWWPDSDVVEGSDTYFELWGVTPTGAVTAAELVRLMHPDDHALAGAVRSRLDHLEYAEYRIRHGKTGEERWLARKGQLVQRGDEPAYLVGVTYDVTERRLAEQRLDAVMESVSDGFIAVDPHWRISLFNSAAERYCQMDRADTLGRSFWDVFDYAVVSPIGDALRQVMTSREAITFEAGSLLHKGRFTEFRISPKSTGGLAISFSDITQRREMEQHRELLLNELNHRVKNSLAIVQAVAHQTLGRGSIPAALAADFQGRLNALAGAHDILTRRNWNDALIDDMLQSALTPFVAKLGERIRFKGPVLRLSPRTAVSFALAFHELATNASKYGALSTDDGRVEINWRLARSQGEARLKLTWREVGGPPVVQPKRRGFGSRMIETALSAELGGSVKIAFQPEGIVCRMDAPLPYLDAQ